MGYKDWDYLNNQQQGNNAQQKYWADLLGQVGGPVRRPLLNLTAEEKEIVKLAFDECGLRV